MLRTLVAIAALAALVLGPSPPAHARKKLDASRWDAYVAPADQCGAGDDAEAMACLINWARARRGLPDLQTAPALESVAREKLRAQLSCDEFSHTPCGRSLASFYRDAGYGGGRRRWIAGENIAITSGGSATPRAIMSAWLASSEHRANIFLRRFAEQGLGVVHVESFAGRRDVTLWTSEFGKVF